MKFERYVIPHSQYQEANFCHKLYNLIKMIVLIAFSVAENVGLPGYFVKIRQKIIPHISIFWSRIQDTAVKGLCSWSQPACKTLTLNCTHNATISRSRDPTDQPLLLVLRWRNCKAVPNQVVTWLRKSRDLVKYIYSCTIVGQRKEREPVPQAACWRGHVTS